MTSPSDAAGLALAGLLALASAGTAAEEMAAGPTVRTAVDAPGLAADTTPRPRPEESLFFRSRHEGLGQITVGSASGLSRVSPTEFARVPFLYDADESTSPIRTLGRSGADGTGRERGMSFRQRDRVRLDVGSRGVEVGDRLQAVRWEGRLDGYGRVARPVAILRVLDRSGETAVAEVTELYGFYRTGAPVLPLPEIPDLRGTRTEVVRDGPRARMLGPAVDRPVVVPGAAVFLSTGTASGVGPGDEFVVPAPMDALDRRTAARLRVIRAGPETATARVLEVRVPDIQPGTMVRLDRRVASGEEG